MEWAGDAGFFEFDADWIVGGPDSGGVRLVLLRDEHLFHCERDFSSSAISRGIPVADFLAQHRGTTDPRYKKIVEDLEARAQRRST